MIFHSYVSLPEGNIDLQMDQLRFLANQKLDAKRKTQQGFGVEIASLGPTNTGAVEKKGERYFSGSGATVPQNSSRIKHVPCILPWDLSPF